MIALELPGHGASPGPGESSVAAYADWVVGFVETLGLRRVILVGCSLGSAIVQWIALSPKEWLAAIGLVGAGARLKVLPDLLDGLQQEEQQRDCLGMLADFCLSPATGDPLRTVMKEKYCAALPAVIHGDLSACDDFDVMKAINSVSVPTCILVGEDDRLTPVKYAAFLQGAISGSRLSVISGAGHLVMLEKPDVFNERFGQFLIDAGLVSSD